MSYEAIASWDDSPLRNLSFGLRTEMSLAILAYNVKRMIRLVGAACLLHAIRA